MPLCPNTPAKPARTRPVPAADLRSRRLLQQRVELLKQRKERLAAATAGSMDEAVPALPLDELSEAPGPPGLGLGVAGQGDEQGEGGREAGEGGGQSGTAAGERRGAAAPLALLLGKRRRVVDVLAQTLGGGGSDGSGSASGDEDGDEILDWRAKRI